MVTKNDVIELSYVGRVKETGEVFDLTDAELAKKEGLFKENVLYGPTPVIVGAGHLLAALDEAVDGMKVSQSKTIEVPPEKAFGERQQERITLVPKKAFDQKKMVPRPGAVVNVQGLLGRIQSVAGGRVLVDFNHPLAGKTLVYEIKIERELTEPKEKLLGLLKLHVRKEVKAELTLNQKKAEIALDGEALLPPEAMKRVGEDAKKYLGFEEVRFTYLF